MKFAGLYPRMSSWKEPQHFWTEQPCCPLHPKCQFRQRGPVECRSLSVADWACLRIIPQNLPHSGVLSVTNKDCTVARYYLGLSSVTCFSNQKFIHSANIYWYLNHAESCVFILFLHLQDVELLPLKFFDISVTTIWLSVDFLGIDFRERKRHINLFFHSFTYS